MRRTTWVSEALSRWMTMFTYETCKPDTVAVRTISTVPVLVPKREIRSRHHSKKKKALPPRQRLQLLYKTTIPIPHEIKVLCAAKIHDFPTRGNPLKLRNLSLQSLASQNSRTLNLETSRLV